MPRKLSALVKDLAASARTNPTLVTLATVETTEAAMVGKDGAVGVSSTLDGKVALSQAIVQLSGMRWFATRRIQSCGDAIR